jgi:hypothetical protein
MFQLLRSGLERALKVAHSFIFLQLFASECSLLQKNKSNFTETAPRSSRGTTAYVHVCVEVKMSSVMQTQQQTTSALMHAQ